MAMNASTDFDAQRSRYSSCSSHHGEIPFFHFLEERPTLRVEATIGGTTGCSESSDAIFPDPLDIGNQLGSSSAGGVQLSLSSGYLPGLNSPPVDNPSASWNQSILYFGNKTGTDIQPSILKPCNPVADSTANSHRPGKRPKHNAASNSPLLLGEGCGSSLHQPIFLCDHEIHPFLKRRVFLSELPTAWFTCQQLVHWYNTPLFLHTLADYVVKLNPSEYKDITQAIQALKKIKFSVWYRLGFIEHASDELSKCRSDAVRAMPGWSSPENSGIALIRLDLKGSWHFAWVRVIFSFTKGAWEQLFRNSNPKILVPTHFAYVEWYSWMGKPSSENQLHRILPIMDEYGRPFRGIISAEEIRGILNLCPLGSVKSEFSIFL